MSALGTEAPSTHGSAHWTHRTPERMRGFVLIRGEARYGAKLTADAVRAIRRSKETNLALARWYGVKEETVRDARNRRTWQHV